MDRTPECLREAAHLEVSAEADVSGNAPPNNSFNPTAR